MNRRDLMKFFAAGTVIAPVAGQAIQAKLIETPKVELVTKPEVLRAVDLSKVRSATVKLEIMDGSSVSLSGWVAGHGILAQDDCLDLSLFLSVGSPAITDRRVWVHGVAGL